MRTFLTKKLRIPATRTLLVTLLLSVILAACGYRGPLYLPDESPAESSPASSTPENSSDPADTESEEEEEGPASLQG